ncbi:MAG TPA: hypothetical protein VFD59_19765 [Nocardioidaceae bacterium]|nr:hypothetical protein [Nocardioidaceae bacterium]
MKPNTSTSTRDPIVVALPGPDTRRSHPRRGLSTTETERYWERLRGLREELIRLKSAN